MNRINTTNCRQDARRSSRLLAATVASGFSLCFFVAALSPALAEEQAVWRPAPTERLVKLPGAYLKKAIERDFSESGLADAIGDRDARIALKAKTLADLRDAVDEAEGEVRTELRHQFLAEKREYVKLLGERQELQRKQLRTKIRVYERILRGLERKAPANEATQQLLKKQEEARERLERSTLNVDLKVFGSGVGKESKYSREYQKNLGAIQGLMTALKDHPMNAEAELDGQQVGRKEYVRQLAANAESGMALLDQEDTILGYMAKLVALDAMALAENLDEDLAEELDAEDKTMSVSSAIGFFINR